MIVDKANLPRILKNLYFTRSEPISLVHFITNRCNARCSFCFIDFDNPETFKGELSLEEINLLTKNLGKSLLNVNLTGGEPFARKDIIEIAKCYIVNSTVQSIYITTNGSLPDRIEKFAKEISEFSPNTELSFQISVDDFPEEHDRVRKISNLFKDCLKSYKILKKFGPKINPVINITVTHENCNNIKNIFYYLVNDCGVESIKCCIVRDEGVYKTPEKKKKKIFEAYDWLTNEINKLCKNKKIKNYNTNSIQGKLHGKKDAISWEMVKKMYLKPKFLSNCYAGGIFGIIQANGDVYPCEILEKNLLGNLRDNKMDLMNIWENQKTKETRKFIINSKCNCTYECALSFNVLANWKYQGRLISSLFNLD
jgi:radical SAM protein with 4Fe4S-binding SPASM domain